MLAKDSSDEPDEGALPTGIASAFNLKQLDLSIESYTEHVREYSRQILPFLDSSEADQLNSKIDDHFKLVDQNVGTITFYKVESSDPRGMIALKWKDVNRFSQHSMFLYFRHGFDEQSI
ncbi:MAG: hypothetical protein VKO39_02735 [Cyanobacteriota bacterium]|nr:hypothetical protein [Cyanobacteriota bacterium]